MGDTTELRIEKPSHGVEVFERDDPEAVLSRAAWLLTLGNRCQELFYPALQDAAPGVQRAPEPPDDEEDADREVLGIPRLEGKLEGGGRRTIQDRYGLESGDAGRGRLVELAHQVSRTRDPYDALALFECGVGSPDALTRVASAIAYGRWTVLPVFIPLLAEVVEGATPQLLEPDGDEADMAATLARNELARIAPDHPALSPFLHEVTPAGGSPSHTSLLVHGTWARFAKWWQPGVGTFHDYLLGNHVPDLYAASDRYEWSGGYSDHARAMAAVQLDGWLAAHTIARLARLVAHSHGGNVAMMATHGTTQADQLVLLSCPVHRSKYLPNFGNVGEVVSFQVHMDLVVLADGGRLKFRHPQIRDETIPLWFKHDASHDEDVWDRYRLADRL
ncbi:MAG: hypothetical protein ACQGVC_11840 [Myxococcota bacterium]